MFPKLNKQWRVVYECGPFRMTFEVEAQSVEEAKMRAGMKRFETLNPRRGFGFESCHFDGRDRREWTIVEITCE